MRFHPYSEVFPLLLEAELAELAEDIKTYGLREKIWLYDGQILDGRNRYLACQRARVKPTYRTFKGDDAAALALVISANIARRHLSEGQRASAAAKISSLRQGQQTGKFAGLTQAQAAETFNVSERSVRSAKKVQEKGSKALNDAMDAGEVAPSRAAAVVNLPKSEQLAAATTPREDAPEMPTDEELASEDEAIEREYAASIAKVMEADDKLAAAHAEIKRQAAEIASLKISRDGFMNGKAEMTRLLGREQNKNERLIKENERLLREIQQLKHRAA